MVCVPAPRELRLRVAMPLALRDTGVVCGTLSMTKVAVPVGITDAGPTGLMVAVKVTD
jgi:hypothetical protein